ncbi:hypothetical protein BT69DRAFT_1331645 [Atractiella rhizophila]|nr:hypothetical protein BT69DRAFT_1331645 [Atractiella rhizophila]
MGREYYLVIWSSASATGDFTRSSHVFSYHGDRLQEAWSSASTVDDDLNDAADGEGNHACASALPLEMTRKKLTLGRLVETSKFPGQKHSVLRRPIAEYEERMSSPRSILAFSYSSPSRYYADESDLINAEASTQIGGWIDAIGDGWGSATGYPSVRGGDGRICGLDRCYWRRMGIGDWEERETAWDAIDAVTLTELNLSEAEIRKRCIVEE